MTGGGSGLTYKLFFTYLANYKLSSYTKLIFDNRLNRASLELFDKPPLLLDRFEVTILFLEAELILDFEAYYFTYLMIYSFDSLENEPKLDYFR